MPKKPSTANQKMAQVQYKIRQNAAEMQQSLKALGKWESDMKKKEKTLQHNPTKKYTANGGKKRSTTKTRHRTVPAVRGTTGSTVYASSTSTTTTAATPHPSLSKHLKQSNTSSPAPAQTQYRSPAEAARARKAAAAASATSPQTTDKNKALDSHTYDKGYKRWETFDVDAELAKVDEEEQPGGTTALPRTTDAPRAPVARTKRRVVNTAASVPTISREELYKQDGNKHYKRGEFQLAIKCYTRCIASNPRNAVAYSNRAQAHVKLKNFLKAEEDCTSGILINPQFVKTWSRRGTARNSLGRHRKLVGLVGVVGGGVDVVGGGVGVVGGLLLFLGTCAGK